MKIIIVIVIVIALFNFLIQGEYIKSEELSNKEKLSGICLPSSRSSKA
jgi:uncharacterized protein YneF (UPF0154 family)